MRRRRATVRGWCPSALSDVSFYRPVMLETFLLFLTRLWPSYFKHLAPQRILQTRSQIDSTNAPPKQSLNNLMLIQVSLQMTKNESII